MPSQVISMITERILLNPLHLLAQLFHLHLNCKHAVFITIKVWIKFSPMDMDKK